MRDIAEHVVEALGARHDVVLVTVVGSKGSTPRNAGSQMLVSKAGLVCGTIGGGAIEGHAITKARTMVGEDTCFVEDLALRPQAPNSIGMVCGGDAVLLYVPICAEDDAWTQVASRLLKCFEQRTPAYLALECREGGSPFKGTVALFDEQGELVAGECSLPGRELVGLKQKRVIDGFFVMPISIPVRAIVFGGGHVGRATIAALAQVGFACTLFECRPEFAQSEDYPDAEQIILGDYEDIASSMSFDERDYIFIMTYSHAYDYAILEQALRQPLAYVGFMGSRRKIAVARQRLLDAGVSEELLDSVHMPIGLDIKAETPEEIAVSVAAECILHRAMYSVSYGNGSAIWRPDFMGVRQA